MNSRRSKLLRKAAKKEAARRNRNIKVGDTPVWAELLYVSIKKSYLKKKRSTNEPNKPKLSRKQKYKQDHEVAMFKIRKAEKKKRSLDHKL